MESVLLEWVSHFEGFDMRLEFLQEFVVDGLLNENTRTRATALPVVETGGIDDQFLSPLAKKKTH